MRSTGLPQPNRIKHYAAVSVRRSRYGSLQVLGPAAAAACYDIGWQANQQLHMPEAQQPGHALSNSQTHVCSEQPMALPAAPAAVSQHQSPAKIMRGIKSCTTLWHLQQHMQNLPPERLNHLHWAAALVHAAQTHLRTKQPLSEQDQVWLLHLTRLATSPECMAQHQPRQISSIMWAIARLQLVEHNKQAFNTIPLVPEMCNIWDSLMVQLHNKSSAALAIQSSHTANTAPQHCSMLPSDGVMALQAMAICSRQHNHLVVVTLVRYLEPHIELCSARDLATFAHAVASLKATVSQSMLTNILARANSLLPTMSIQQTAAVVCALPSLFKCDENTISTRHPVSQEQQADNIASLPAHMVPHLQQLRTQLLDYLAAGLPADLPAADAAAMLWGLSKLGLHPGHDVMQRLLAAASMDTSHNQPGSQQHAINGVGDTQSDHSNPPCSSVDVASPTVHHHHVGQVLHPIVPDATSSDHVTTLESPSPTPSRAAANAITAAARLGASVHVGCLEAALNHTVQLQQGMHTQLRPRNAKQQLQDIAAMLSAAAKSGAAPSPQVMDRALLAAANVADATESVSKNLQLITPIIWSLAKLVYVVDARLLHKILATAMKWNLQEAMQRFKTKQIQQQQQQAVHPPVLNNHMSNVCEPVSPVASVQGQPFSSSVNLSCISQLLWSVAVLLKADRQQHMVELGVAAQVISPNEAASMQNIKQQQQQHASHQQQTAVPMCQTTEPGSQARRRLDLHPLLLHDLLMLTEQSVRVADVQQVATHLPQLTWALGSLTQTLQQQLPLKLRTQLMQAVACSVPKMDAHDIAVCISALRGCGCHRRLDNHNMLHTVMTRILSPENNLVSQKKPWEVAACYGGLAQLGYVLRTRHLISTLAAATINRPLWQSKDAKELLSFVTQLSMLGLAQLMQQHNNTTAGSFDSSHLMAHEEGRKPSVTETVYTFQQKCVSSLFRSKALARFHIQDIIQLVQLCTTLRLHPTCNQWKQLLGHAMLLTTGNYTPVARKPKDASISQNPPISKKHNHKPVTSSQCTALLYALARYESCMAAGADSTASMGLLRYGLPHKAWMQRMLQYIMGDLSSLAPVGIAQLLASLTRLQCHNAHWLRVLNLQLEVRSAVLSKADHALIQQAWTQLGAGTSHKSKHGVHAKLTELTNFSADVPDVA